MTTEQFINQNEAARLNALRDLKILDTSPSESFDRLTRMASRLLGAPVSAISLTDHDRQWFKSRVGVDLQEIPREQAPCSYAIQGSGVFVVPDLLEDERFRTSPLAKAGIRFYAGAPLVTRAGFGLGAMTVIDDKPRQIGADERRTLQDLAGMVMAQIEIQNMIGRVDATTGYPNQHQLFEDLEQQATQHPRRNAAAVLVEIMTASAIAHATRVLGTSHADTVAKRAMQAIQRGVGNSARLYHVGQMRCVVLGDVETPRATTIARQVMLTLAEPIPCGGVPVNFDLVVGCYDFVTGEAAAEDVLRRLLNAGDDAREADGRIASYDPVHDQRMARSFALVNDFSAALAADDQLQLVYQPRIELATGRVLGVEALLRWCHPTLGNVPPGEFVPLVEQTALVRPMTEWVFAAAIRQTLAWTRSGLDLCVSVNVSARNLDESDFAERLLRAVREAHLDTRHLELEFTESATARDQASLTSQLEVLHEAGIAIAIDDFGTGYSNASYIQHLPVSVLKVDRSFVTDLATSERSAKLVRSMVAMARDLGYRVVAEGIETQEVYDLLVAFGCDEGQGYFMAKPMPASDIKVRLGKANQLKVA
ncbi:sensor domain-containing phosphodiesterase [Lichenibacterium minor]|nr:sensor domain-containing phosphodiesterase [Lichenibacterium minor]